MNAINAQVIMGLSEEMRCRLKACKALRNQIRFIHKHGWRIRPRGKEARRIAYWARVEKYWECRGGIVAFFQGNKPKGKRLARLKAFLKRQASVSNSVAVPSRGLDLIMGCQD